MLERFRVSRARLLQDPHYPRYHFSSPENRLNNPNGLSFWNGKWHMFYQGYPPEDPRQHWGHAISNDLIHCALTAGQTADGPGGKWVRAAYLHRSKDLANWEYLHQFL